MRGLFIGSRGGAESAEDPGLDPGRSGKETTSCRPSRLSFRLLNSGTWVVREPVPIPGPLPRKLRRDVGGRSLPPGLDGLRKSPFLRRKRSRRGADPEDGGVPVEPNRPDTLSGGAAAALDFEEG